MLILKSIWFFILSIFIKRRYDVVFYYPQHFNRGKQNKNVFFDHLINACKEEGFSYTIFEEPDFYSNSKRNPNAVPFDFIFVIIIILRRMFNSEMIDREKDTKIGGFLAQTFFRNITFNNVITISQSMISIFRGIDESCSIFDVQHGIIHPNKENYLMEGIPAENIVNNRIQLLLNGNSYKKIIVDHDSTSYFHDNSYVVGSHIFKKNIQHSQFNGNILVVLQFTQDHSENENAIFLKSLEKIIRTNDNKTITFYIKNHPRFNGEIDLENLHTLTNVKHAPIDINDCFELCSLQITAYSTSVFEAALKGIPTIIVNPILKYNYFKKYFDYTCSKIISDFFDQEVYNRSSIKVHNWASTYYCNFNKIKFITLLR